MKRVEITPQRSRSASQSGVAVSAGRATMASTLSLPSSKVKDWHLQRKAVVYIRQSTPQQVLEHHESADRQYALVYRAELLGWPADRVEVVDEDQGHSGQSAVGRLGFQYLLAEISLDHVGLILGLEMSRLARSNKDWHQLLELCTIFRVLLADQDGLYDPTDYNDRLLLGLKGTMSEAELHILRGRMYRGLLNKARRGEVYNHPPSGYVKLPTGVFALGPDEQVQDVIRMVFDLFDRLGTNQGLLRYLVKHGIRMPIRPHAGPNRGQLEWHRPNRVTLQNLLRHSIHAGYYRWGHRELDAKWLGVRVRVALCVHPKNAWYYWRIIARPTSRQRGSGVISNAWTRTVPAPGAWAPCVMGRRSWADCSSVASAAAACWFNISTPAPVCATVAYAVPSTTASHLARASPASGWTLSGANRCLRSCNPPHWNCIWPLPLMSSRNGNGCTAIGSNN